MNTVRAIDRLTACSPTISCGAISADLMHLARDLETLKSTGLDVLHFDVMDGCHVPTLTAGPPFIKAIKTSFLKDVHLMIEDPAAKVGDYVAAGADIITVHIEACHDIGAVLRRLATMENANDPARGLVRGVGLYPSTPVEVLKPLLDDLELVVMLAIDPREKRPSFAANTAERCAAVQALARDGNNTVFLCVDGGVTLDNIDEIAQMGADLVVSGSALFGGAGLTENVPKMLETLKTHAS